MSANGKAREFWIDPEDIKNNIVWSHHHGNPNRIHVREVLKNTPINEDEIESLKAMIKLWEERNLENVAEIERLQKAFEKVDPAFCQQEDEITKLKAALSEAKADTERLEYLYKKATLKQATRILFVELDPRKAIDEAMREGK